MRISRHKSYIKTVNFCFRGIFKVTLIKILQMKAYIGRVDDVVRGLCLYKSVEDRMSCQRQGS